MVPQTREMSLAVGTAGVLLAAAALFLLLPATYLLWPRDRPPAPVVEATWQPADRAPCALSVNRAADLLDLYLDPQSREALRALPLTDREITSRVTVKAATTGPNPRPVRAAWTGPTDAHAGLRLATIETPRDPEPVCVTLTMSPAVKWPATMQYALWSQALDQEWQRRAEGVFFARSFAQGAGYLATVLFIWGVAFLFVGWLGLRRCRRASLTARQAAG
jgi:hypothetical protein